MRSIWKRLRFAVEHRWAQARASAYIDGELPGRQRGRLERHVGDCPECRTLLRELRALVSGLAALGGAAEVPVAAAIRSSVHSILQRDAGAD